MSKHPNKSVIRSFKVLGAKNIFLSYTKFIIGRRNPGVENTTIKRGKNKLLIMNKRHFKDWLIDYVFPRNYKN